MSTAIEEASELTGETTHKWVYLFEEGSGDDKSLLGGKGAVLCEMTHAGLPVPPGLVVTTEACNAFFENDKSFPAGMWEHVKYGLQKIEEMVGKKFGDPQNPLLVSVRSGAAISMPGMMDTILNLGLSDESVEGLSAATGNRRFAYDSYRRLIQMYGEVVDGIDAERFEHALADLKSERGVQQDVELSADDLRELVDTFKRIYEDEIGRPFPQDAG